jgi:hypothetical protein
MSVSLNCRIGTPKKTGLEREAQALLVEAQEDFRISLEKRLRAQKMYQVLVPHTKDADTPTQHATKTQGMGKY